MKYVSEKAQNSAYRRSGWWILSIFFLFYHGLPVPAGGAGASMTHSLIQIDTSPTPDRFHYPDPVILQVYLNGPQPISGARVTAEVRGPSGATQRVSFREAGGTGPNDVRYSAVVTPLHEDGVYLVNVIADDNQSRATFAAGLESEPRPGQERSAACAILPLFKVEKIFQFTAHGYGSKQDFQPSRVTDLYIERTPNGCYLLNWTAPLGLKTGSRYEVRASRAALTSEKAWQEAESLTTAAYSAKGGDQQTETVCLSGKGRFYLAVRSLSAGGLESAISNDYVVEANY
jgi:hypothetical protein